MKIHHYTTLPTLALILKSREIRFNRLDKMDDLNERSFYSLGRNWSKYTYVSCWTEDETENIPLWNMYASQGKGVRLSIDKDFIDWNLVENFYYIMRDQFHKPPKQLGQVCIECPIIPISFLGKLTTESVYSPITYIKEDDWVNEINISGQSSLLPWEIDYDLLKKYVGLYKDCKWSFQGETRFRVFALPRGYENLTFEEYDRGVQEEINNPLQDIYFPIKDTALQNIEILLGPNMTAGEQELCTALLDKFCPTAIGRSSSLGDSHWTFNL